MCLGIPGQVVALSNDRPDVARVDVQGVVRDINIALLQDSPPAAGDWVMIHLGFALEPMTEAEAMDAMGLLRDEAMAQDAAAVR